MGSSNASWRCVINLPAALAQANSNSYFSRSESDQISAANSAGLLLFQAIEREHRGNFIQIDTTSVTLTPGQTQYPMPADFDSLLHIAERSTANVGWAELSASNSIGAIIDWASQPGTAANYSYALGGYSRSPFSFYGPYLPASSAAVGPGVAQQYVIQVAPQVDVLRAVELIYIARWIEIVSPRQAVMLPDPAQAAFISLTTANLLDMNGDTMAGTYRARALGNGHQPGEISLLLSWARGQARRNWQLGLFGDA